MRNLYADQETIQDHLYVRKILALSQDKTIKDQAAEVDGIMNVSKLEQGAEIKVIGARKMDDPGQMQIRQPVRSEVHYHQNEPAHPGGRLPAN
jgi:hypothetical protein